MSVAGSPPPDCAAVPGFTQKGRCAYAIDTLFEYMNGNSEGYFAYGFQRMQGVTCTNGTLDLVFDISQMETPDLAWGMFTANRDPKLPLTALGTVGQVTPRRGAFAKGVYYLELAANPVGDQALLERFLAAWDRRIEGATARPALLDVFPARGLKADSAGAGIGVGLPHVAARFRGPI
jgi:hypothetical protein